MQRILLKSKIHRCRITDSNINYSGSITIDPELLEASDMIEHEKVLVVDINNGNRFETYIILGTPGRREVVVNGAAARLVTTGDLAIVMSFAHYNPEETLGHCPRVVLVDPATNHLVRESSVG